MLGTLLGITLGNKLGQEVFSRPILMSSFRLCRDVDDLILLRFKHIGEYIYRLDIRFAEVVQILLSSFKLGVSEALLYRSDVDPAVQEQGR